MGKQIPPFASASDRGYKFLCTFQAIGMPRSDTRVVWVEGGIPPYSWSITGTGFALSNATTTVQYNIISAAADVAVNTIETLTVLDSNSESVTCRVHLTDWNEEPCCGGGGTERTSPCCDKDDYSFAYSWADAPAAGKYRIVRYSGGCPPYTWSIVDNSEYLSLTSSVTNVPEVMVYIIAGAPIGDIDLSTDIYVEDDCSGGVCCDLLSYEAVDIDDDNTDTTITFGDPAAITITGGCPPYTWSIDGSKGYSIVPSGVSDSTVATLSVISGSCRTGFDPKCVVTIVDDCGESCSVIIYHIEGEWEYIAGFGRTGVCNLTDWCCGYNDSGVTCALNGTLATVYRVSTGTGGAYVGKWEILRILGCVINPLQGDCREANTGNHTMSGTCGSDTILGPEYGCGDNTCCDCSGSLYFWTCGAECF